MKVIPKFQDGGFMSLFTTYVPTLSASPSLQSARGSSSGGSSSSSDEKDSAKGKLTEKDLFELISKVDGLPNDTKALVSSLSNMFLMLQLMGGSTNVSDLANTYLLNLYSIKLASYNKKEYDKAYELVTKNGGLNEYAITPSGLVIVMDSEDNLKQVSVQEFLKDSDKYRALTNSNLLYLRAYQPEYSNNNQILATVSNGIGMELVDKMIRERLSNLGTSESVRSGYSVKADSYITLGLNVLSQVESAAIVGQTGMTLDGLYKNKVITKDQKQLAEAALLYIYNTLPDNAKALLSVKSGNASNPREGAVLIILQLITSRMSPSMTLETDYEGTLEQVLKTGTRSKSKSSSGDTDDLYSDDVKTDPYYNMSRSLGGEPTNMTINKGTRFEMSTSGTLYSSIPDKNGDPIGQTSLLKALESGLLGVVIDPLAITFGDVTLTSLDFKNIMFDGNSGGTLAILPVKKSVNGTKMVDLNVLDRWQTANEDLNKMGIDSVFDQGHLKEIAQVLYNNNLENLVNPTTGTIDYNALGLFLVVDGYAVDNTSKNKFKNSQYVYKTDDDPEEIQTIERALSTDKDQSNYKIDVDNWYDLNGHDNVYSGSIYIPITSNLLKALTASGLKIKEGPAMLKETEFQMLQKRLLARQPKFGIL